jgi:Ca-activated chloride channel homolog
MRFSLIAAALLAPVALAAQGRMIPMCDIPADGPRGLIPCQAQIVRTRSDVRGALAGRVVRYTVTEEFVNRGGRLGEADYLFPLPPGAAFRDLKLSINGRMVSGETMDAQHARGVYEEIVRKLRDPALVEWMGSGLLRTRIFPIQPGETKRVVVSYEGVVPREGDALRVEYQRGAAVRPPAGTPGRPFDARPVETTGDQSDGWTVRQATSFELAYERSAALGAPYSPTNRIQMRDDGRTRVVRVLGDASNVTLLFPLRLGNRAAITVLTHAQRGDSGFAMITVSPPALRETPSARDVTFVVDVSGSMSGRKMEQARAAGMQLLATLRPTDRFRLIDFSNDVRDFRDGFTYATPRNIEAGRRYLAGLSAGGGTNIGAALDDALRGQDQQGDPRYRGYVKPDPEIGPTNATGHNERDGGDANRLSLVLFLTDGMPTVGITNATQIAEVAERERGGARLFTFGLGADVNSALLEQLAMDGRGTVQFVRPDEDVERMVGVVASRLTDPVATDLRVRVDGHDVQLRDVVPSMPMDLFGGEDLVVMARYTGHGSARVTVEGRSRGRSVRWTSDADFADASRDNGFIPRLWAAQRIGYLSAERRRHGANAEVDDEIRALGERYGIPTEFTSYLVQEPRDMAALQAAAPVNGSRAANGAIDVRTRSAGKPQALDVHGVVTGSMAAPQASFEAAKMASAQRAANSTATLDSLSAAAGGGANGARVVDGHAFTLRDGRWVDGRLTDSTRTVQVQAFSTSYFALLDRIPELRAMVALGPRVVMVGRDVAIEIAPQASELTGAELDRVVRAW